MPSARLGADARHLALCDGRFMARVASTGAVVRYIPPYCWFLSPLDNGAYGRLVAWLRANAEWAARVGMKHACDTGLGACMSDEDNRRCWYQCGFTRV